MTPAQRRRFFAIIGSHWDKEIGEYIAYATMIARYGKASTKALTPNEIDDLFNWLDWATGETQDG